MLAGALLAVLMLAGCTEVQFASHVIKSANPPVKSEGTFKVGNPYKIEGKKYYPRESYDYTETGIASWYGPQFHGKKTANGEIFDMNELTGAHRTLQMPSLVRVTNLENGKSLIVRINDRGPYKKGRVIDVSKKAANLLGFIGKGTAKVKLEVLKKESINVASLARRGVDTKGYELALNAPTETRFPSEGPGADNGYILASAGQDYPTDQKALAIAPVSSERLDSLSPEGLQTVVPGHTRNGAFYPDPIITEVPVVHTDIFIQAGSFTSHDNAVRLASSLGKYGRSEVYPAIVNGRQFFRVRVGPVPDVIQADQLLARVVGDGIPNAIIVVN
jgi:rare lipoprotein A